MASQSADPQTNGVPASSGASASQTAPNTQATATTSAAGGSQPPSQTQPTQSSSTQQTSQPSQQNAQQKPGQQQQSTPLAPNASAPRPRDSRMIELLLTSQGVTSYESRVPLLLLDFAYRHTSSILSDAIYLSADPYTSQAGSKASGGGGGGAGSIPGAVGDAAVSANAVKLAIAARLGYQFRGGGGAGGVSKDWLQELARERNKTALPKVAQNEWGLRLPSERFVLSGVSWGLKEAWEEAGMDEDEDEDGEDGAAAAGPGGGGEGAMEGVEATADEDIGGDGVEGGTMEDVFGKDVDEDAEMEGTS
ncbi:transcription initiation factor IID, 31kD subunit-domain-containing protein [Colletotrichum godetiae]|uniref:Transcription initiation factor IID, 31kD subunit-domain-containing protein n=1 Tax=Colletotrichum godetiae TaxID=1209918 RepID=A0AAJ0F2A5_9PEZI|nr:transcription initiation factor IID, 31kD subunit-domain-containing protein [Colletotrichum godetiae]KAK1690297.1 transcription initiation factor IID, 31kD subunit-domain-containing protein [Colletotrichum godetiae]